MSGLDSYDNGTKQTWRGWVWNRIAERIRKLDRPTATVAYLCGPYDFDRQCALKRGFRNENIVAIDINLDNIKKVRESGGIGMSDFFPDAIKMWNPTDPLGVVVADFCCGLTLGAIDFGRALVGNPGIKHGAVIAINLLRGRDPQSREFRQLYWQPSDGVIFKGASPMHRGLQWISELVITIGKSRCKSALELGNYVESTLHEIGLVWTSYRSGSQVFDTVVFRWPYASLRTKRAVPKKLCHWKAVRETRTEAKRKVRFNYQSLVAKQAALTNARRKSST